MDVVSGGRFSSRAGSQANYRPQITVEKAVGVGGVKFYLIQLYH